MSATPVLALVTDGIERTDDVIVAEAIAALKRGGTSSWEAADRFNELSERDWTHQKIADACGVSRTHVTKFIACARNCSLVNNRPSFWEAFSEVNSTKESHNHRAQDTGENEWYTPAKYIEAARRVLGTIELDPASSDAAQEVVQAKRYYTREQDGLAKKWRGRVWLNPPYSQPDIQKFIEKLVNEYELDRVHEAIVLTHNYTDTAWFHTIAEASAAILFTRGRVGFVNPDGESCNPTQGQAFFYLGDRPGAFTQEFADFGFMVRPL